jgi:hypothetical protein
MIPLDILAARDKAPTTRPSVAAWRGVCVMRVFHSTMGKVQGGRMEEVVGVAGEAAKLIGRHGGDVRFFLASAAGEQVNTTVFTIQYDSPEALGAAFDELTTDVELQALMTRLSGSDSPSEIISQSMGMEMPIGREPKAGRGDIIEVHLSRIAPGRTEEALREAAEVCDFVEANGAVGARLIQLTYAGLASGTYAITWELENMRAHARLGAVWFSDAGLALQAKTMTASPAVVRVSSALYTEVPL